MHIYSATRKLIRGLVWSNGALGSLLRRRFTSPAGVEGEPGKSGSLYPLPLTQQCKDALWHFAGPSQSPIERTQDKDCNAKQSFSKKDTMQVCPAAWCGLLVIGLNSSLGFTTNAVDVEARQLSWFSKSDG